MRDLANKSGSEIETELPRGDQIYTEVEIDFYFTTEYNG